MVSRLAPLALVLLLFGGLLVLINPAPSGSAAVTSRLTSDTPQPLNTATVVEAKGPCSFTSGTSHTCAFVNNVVAGNTILVMTGVKNGWTGVQTKTGCGFASGTSHTCAYASNVVTGSTLIVAIGTKGSKINTPTDSLSTVYHLLGSCGNNTATACVFYGAATSGGANTVTVPTEASIAGNLVVYEITGIVTAGATSSTGTGTCTASTPFAATTGSVSFTNQAFLVAVIATTAGSVSSISVPTGMQLIVNSNAAFVVSSFNDFITVSPTTFSSTSTPSSNCNWATSGGEFAVSASTPNTPTDSQGNSYSLVGSCQTNVASGCIYAATAGSTAADTITSTITVASAGSIFLIHASGITTTGATLSSNSAACSANPFTYSGPSQAFSNLPLLVGYLSSDQSSGTVNPQSGYTAGSTSQGQTVEYATSGIASPATFQFTSSSTTFCSTYVDIGAIFPQSPSTSYVTTGLSVPIQANANYFFTASIYATNAGGSSLNFEIKALSSATLVQVCGNSGSSSNCVTATGTPIFSSALTGATLSITITGTITGGASGDTLEIDFSNVAAAAGSVVVIKSGSSLEAIPVQ